MAKRCNVCKKTYPDNERTCPYCAKADADEVEAVEEAVEVEEAPPEETTKPSLKKPAQPTKMASAPKPTMLAGDDIDILAEEVSPGEEEGPKDKPPSKAGKAGDSKKTQMAAHTAQPTQLAKKAPAPTMLAPPGAQADSVDAAIGEAPAGPAKKTGSKSDVSLVGDETPTGPSKKTGSKSDVSLVGDEAIVEGASEVNLGDMPGGQGDRPSGLDLIAEAVESGEISKKGKSTDVAKPPAVGEDEAADFLGDESSAVDLGSAHDITVTPFPGEKGVVMPKSGSGKAKGKVAQEPSEEPVDAVDEMDSEAVEEAEAEEAPEEADEKHAVAAAGGTATKTAPKAKSSWVPGILVGVAGAVVVMTGMSVATDIVAIKPLNDAMGKKAPKSAQETKLEKDLASAQQGQREATGKIDAAEKGEKAAKDSEAAAKKELLQAKTALEEAKKTQNKPLEELRMNLAKEKADHQKASDSLVEANKLVDGLQTDLKDAGYNAASAKEVPAQLKKLIAKQKADDGVLADAAKTLQVDKDKIAGAVKKLDADKKAADMDRTRLGAVVKCVRDKLTEGKFLTGDASKDEAVMAGLDKALKQAISPLVTALGKTTTAVVEAAEAAPDAVAGLVALTRPAEREALLGYFRLREPLVQTPQKMLDAWIPLLENMDRANAAELGKKAIIDANWVKKQDLQATPVDKAKAEYLLGLAQRNQLNYVEAKKVLEPLAAGPEKTSDPAYKKRARQVLWEITDPLAYYLRYGHLQAQGKLDRMLAELDAGVKAATGAQKGSLLALTSQAHLEKAVTAAKNKKLDPKAPDVIQADVAGKDAIAAGAVEEGNYVLGLKAELLGDLNTALNHYKVAAQYKGRRDLASLYRLALARVLLKAAPAPAAEKKAPTDKTDKTKADALSGVKAPVRLTRSALLRQVLAARANGSLTPATMFLVLNMVMLVADDEEEGTPRNIANIEAAIKLAREAIELGDPRGYLMLGAAEAQKAQWTKGLNSYITGMEKLYPGLGSQGLRQIFDEHPLFKLSDPERPPQPLVAEKHYGAGLTYFWDQKYERAEEEFKEAVRFFNKDARYFYYLGLSQLLQKPSKLGAANESFGLARRLELQGSPESDEVNNALERVQGQPRSVLGKIRQKP
jgi:hypothetical protein